MTFNRLITNLLGVLVLAAAATGCIKEDADDCRDTCRLTVRAYDNSGSELTQSDVSDVTLYVFDANKRFLERIDTRIGQSVSVEVAQGEDVHIVGWGNLTQADHSYTQPAVGDHLDDCLIGLKADTRAVSYYLSPADLFRGAITITAQDRDGEKLLPMYREAGSMTVIIRGLKEYAGFSDNDYTIEVGETPTTIGFDGTLTGSGAYYRPTGSFVAGGSGEEYSVPAFNMLPQTSGVQINIYHGTQLIDTVTRDSSGNAIAVEKGKLTNVLINYSAEVSVSVAVTAWGVNQVWKEF